MPVQSEFGPWKANLFLLLINAVPTATVPQLIGLAQDAGVATIVTTGFVLQLPITFASGPRPVGIISSQAPTWPNVRPLGSAISIVVSSGPVSPNVPGQNPQKLPNLPNQILPPSTQLVDERGVIKPNWWRFLLNVSQTATGTNPTGPASITVTASPFVYTASVQGSVIVSGGPVSLIEYSKDGQLWFPTGQTGGVFQMVANDQLRVTYTNQPAMTFFPR